MGATNGKLEDYDPLNYKDETVLDLNPAHYPNFGNYHWDRRPLKEITKLSLEEQMKLSDAITRKYALNPKFINMQQASLNPNDINLDDINQTSVGNVAFMVYHHPETVCSQFYEKLLEKINNS